MNVAQPDIDIDRNAFCTRIINYLVTAETIRRIGYDEALEVAHWYWVTGLIDDEALVPYRIDLTTAIHLSMTLGEHLEFDSPRSWMDRQREGGAV